MGQKSSKKKTYYRTTIVETKVIKLSYLQTLGVMNNLKSVDSLETSGVETHKTSGSKSSSSSFFGLGGSSSKKTNYYEGESGEKIKEQWLQPYFDRIRYAIGIRELSVSRYEFAKASELISTPYLSPKEIIKVHLMVDEYIPPQFDRNLVWIKYFIKVEGEDEWVQVNPLKAPSRFGEGGNVLPRIVNFNIPKPTNADINEEKFRYTEGPVHKLRFRALLTRPLGEDSKSITPLLKGYKLVLTPREL